MLVEAYSGYVTLEVDGKRVTIYGERYDKGHGNPTFVAYTSALKKWVDGTQINVTERLRIKTTLAEDFKDRGWTLECE